MTQSAPLFYIRYLKPPPTTCLVGQHFTIVWTIENDLGDQTCWETVPVSISVTGSPQLGLRELNADPKGSSKKKAAVLAKPYMQQKVALAREIPLVFDPLRGGGIVTKLVIEQLPGQPLPVNSQVDIQLGMTVAPAARSGSSHPVWPSTYEFQQMWLIPSWSSPITATVAKQRHGDATDSGNQAERRVIANGSLVCIREDAVQSIARHVWDCGLGMCQFLSEYKLNSEFSTFLELGSGTGLVGIYAAQLLKPKRVYLTDLPDALEIMQQNIDLMGSTQVNMSVLELDWCAGRRQDLKDVDLVLLTDVLYNQSSHDVLLDSLDWLLDNKSCKALLTYKERNPDEREFFEKVKKRNWTCQRIENYDHLVCEVYWIFK